MTDYKDNHYSAYNWFLDQGFSSSVSYTLASKGFKYNGDRK